MITHVTERKGQVWQGWKPGEYQCHYIHTGVAEAIFHIFPDGTTLLLDCGDHPALTRLQYAVPVVPNPGRLAGDWIARYIKRVMPSDCAMRNGLPLVDMMMLSHFHSDHCGIQMWQTANWENKEHRLPDCYRSGFALAAEQLAFDTAIDRGWPDYCDPRTNCVPHDEYDHVMRLYRALQKRDGLKIEKFRLGATNQLVPRHQAVPGFEIQNITCNGRILCRDGSIRNLYEAKLKQGGNLNENGMSLGVIVRYGAFSMYLAGDFSDRIIGNDGAPFETESALAAELPEVDVAKINHHGHQSMPEPIVSALRASAWTACVWDQLHTLDPVLTRLSDRNLYAGERMHFPTVFPKERCATAAELPFFKDIAPETFGLGAHVVVTVPQGGRTYLISCLEAADESMTILGEYDFASKGSK